MNDCHAYGHAYEGGACVGCGAPEPRDSTGYVKLQEPGYPEVVLPVRDEAHVEQLILWYQRDAVRRSVPLRWEYVA